MGTDVNNCVMGRVGCAYIGTLLQGSGKICVSLFLGDMDGDPSYRKDAGGIPLQGGP